MDERRSEQRMKHVQFFLICMAFLAFLFTIVGVLALLDYPNAEVIFWTKRPIESDAGKLVWVAASGIAFLVFSVLSVKRYRKGRR